MEFVCPKELSKSDLAIGRKGDLSLSRKFNAHGIDDVWEWNAPLGHKDEKN